MRKIKQLMLWMFLLAPWSAGAVFAQNLTGAWQGTLQPPGANRDLRTVIVVSRADDESLKAVMYSIDQGAQPIPVSTVTLQGSSVKMLMPGIGGAYEGTLSADGNSIKGTWTQGPRPLTLNLARPTPETAWAIPEPPKPVKRMAADADPAFEVAVIKPSSPDEQGKGLRVRGRQLSTVNTNLSDLLTFAYGLHPRQIVGGAPWLEGEKFDLLAEPDGEGQPSDRQWRIMIQKLMADRFKLSFHREKKELSVYVITAGKTGPKLTKSLGDPDGLPGLNFPRIGTMAAHNANIDDLAGLLQRAVLDRPVLDQTGIAGRYDFTLNWTPDESQFAGLGIKPEPPTDSAMAPPDLYNAIQQQLGLKLESTKAQTDVLVIDHVEEPSPN